MQRLVEPHHGTVIAFSAGPDEGRDFTVRLPVLAETVPDAASAEDTPMHVAPTARRVLVVDDNEDSANSLVVCLRLIGHDACAAYGGADALEAAGFNTHLVKPIDHETLSQLLIDEHYSRSATNQRTLSAPSVWVDPVRERAVK